MKSLSRALAPGLVSESGLASAGAAGARLRPLSPDDSSSSSCPAAELARPHHTRRSEFSATVLTMHLELSAPLSQKRLHFPFKLPKNCTDISKNAPVVLSTLPEPSLAQDLLKTEIADEAAARSVLRR